MSAPEDISGGFNPEHFAPPSNETKQEFKIACLGLEKLAHRSTTNAVSAEFSNEIGVVRVHISSWEWTEPGETPSSHSVLTATIMDERNNFPIYPGSSNRDSIEPEDTAHLDKIKNSVIIGLDEASGRWLTEVLYEAGAEHTKDRTLQSLAVERLIDTSPVPVLRFSKFTVQKTFANGSKIIGTWIEADEETKKVVFPPEHATLDLELELADGSEYNYTQVNSGEERMFIKKPGDHIEPKVEPSNEYSVDVGHGLTVSVSGDPEFIASLQKATAAREEASLAGADKITDGSLKEFTALLNEAMSSGIVFKEPPLA